MMDREKAIKGLEHCIEKLDTVVNKTHGFNCIDCPYFRKCDRSGYLIGLPLMRDAFALLKAQEPRVITLEYFDNSPDKDSNGCLVAWVEYRRDEEWAEYWEDTCDEWSVIRRDDFYSGESYRFWTSRPTDEQREAVKWND